MDNYDAETKLFEIVFMFKTFIDSHKNVILALGLSNQPSVGESAPLGFATLTTS